MSEEIKIELFSYIAIAIIAILFLTIASVWLVITYIKTKNKFIREKIQRELQFKNEIIKTQSEIQNQTLNYVGRELHDNLGQLLAVAKIYSNSIANTVKSKKSQELNQTLDYCIKEMRALSHTLNTERVQKFDLIQFLNQEVSRIKNTDKFDVELMILQPEYNTLVPDTSIIIFRIIQEFISNSIKYSKASKISIKLNFKQNFTSVRIEDNGIGFDTNEKANGTGLQNIQSRIQLLNSKMILKSEPNKGTILKFDIEK